MHRVIRVKPLPAYRLFVEFSDGLKGEVDLSTRLFGAMFEPLQDANYFAQAALDEFGVIGWPNGADLAPDALHEVLMKSHANA